MATTNDDNNKTCNPCAYCQNAWSKAATRYEPEDSGCKAEDDPRMDGWEPNGTTPCPCFKPFLASDNLYEQLQNETEFGWHLQEIYESDRDYERKELAMHLHDCGEKYICELLEDAQAGLGYRLHYELALARHLRSLKHSRFYDDYYEYKRLIKLHGIGFVRRIMTYIGCKP